MGEEDGEDSHFGCVAVITPEHLSLNVHGIPPSRKHREEDAAPWLAPLVSSLPNAKR